MSRKYPIELTIVRDIPANLSLSLQRFVAEYWLWNGSGIVFNQSPANFCEGIQF
jgi:hypothetical protein